jgi:hypothetical protein
MKILLFSAFLFLRISGFSQNLQLHYDIRHKIDSGINPINFPTFSFEYFKNIDSINKGSFLLKLQADLNGKNNNVGQVYTQISQSVKFWKPKVFLLLNYSGGLGVTSDFSGYYLANSYGLGVSYPFQWKGAWFSANLIFRYEAFNKASYDPQLTLYFGKGFFNYRVFTGGSFVFWTENRNQGNDYTKDLKGKKFAFFGDPQIWFKIQNGFSIGSRINLYYHLLTSDNKVQIYPTVGVKNQF